MKKLSLNEHKEVGKRLRIVNFNLSKALIVLSRGHGNTKSPTPRLEKLIDKMNSIRSELDSILARDYPKLPREEFLEIYFGGTPIKDCLTEDEGENCGCKNR